MNLNQRKFIIKDVKNKRYYNFANNTWIKELTYGCLNNFSNTIKFISKTNQEVKIKQFKESINYNDVLDVVL